MKFRNIPFSPPDISDEEIAAVVETLKSGWITTGPRVKMLERKISDWLGASGCVCLNSQTACAETTLRILEIGKGDEVIVPTYTYTATASVVGHVGAKPIFIDCQKDNLEMDYDKLEKAITCRTKAIIPVDIGGIPCDYDRIFKIVTDKKPMFSPAGEIQTAIGRIAVVADAAHALGAIWHDRKVGTIADFTNFSFHAVKNLTTGEGGACTWKTIVGINNEDIYKKAQLLSLHGQSKSALDKTLIGAWEYDIVGQFYKCNMTDIAAAIGLAQLERYPAMLKRRKEIIEKYDANFKPLGIEVLNHYTGMCTSSGHLYITRIPEITENERNEIIIKMAKAGIACNVHYKPLPMHTAYMNMGMDIKDYPNSYAHYKNEITLPLHTKLTDEDVDYIILNYASIVKEYL